MGRLARKKHPTKQHPSTLPVELIQWMVCVTRVVEWYQLHYHALTLEGPMEFYSSTAEGGSGVGMVPTTLPNVLSLQTLQPQFLTGLHRYKLVLGIQLPFEGVQPPEDIETL